MPYGIFDAHTKVAKYFQEDMIHIAGVQGIMSITENQTTVRRSLLGIK